jgi:hypothetical protein
MEKLSSAPKKELMTFMGGENRGDPCEAFAYHGFNGLGKDNCGKDRRMDPDKVRLLL